MKVICDHAQGCKIEDCPHIKKHESESLFCEAASCRAAKCPVKCIPCGDDETMDCSKCREALLKRVKEKFAAEVEQMSYLEYKLEIIYALDNIFQEELKK